MLLSFICAFCACSVILLYYWGASVTANFLDRTTQLDYCQAGFLAIIWPVVLPIALIWDMLRSRKD